MITKLAKLLSPSRRKEEGFTLIELLIVVAIIAILAAIAIPQFSAYRSRGYMAAVRSDGKNAYTAITAYFSDQPGATVAASTTAGPATLPTPINAARVTAGVTLAVGAGTAGTFTVTATHVNLVGSYVLAADGAATDTLVP